MNRAHLTFLYEAGSGGFLTAVDGERGAWESARLWKPPEKRDAPI
jgi:hypothetical protein